MPAVKRTKSVAAKEMTFAAAPAHRAPLDPQTYGPAQLPWVVEVLGDALSKAEYWIVGEIATTYSQFQKAKVDGKDSVAFRRLAHLRSLAAMHVTASIDAKYQKKRDALLAAETVGKAGREALTLAVQKLRGGADRARARALEAAGVPVA